MKSLLDIFYGAMKVVIILDVFLLQEARTRASRAGARRRPAR